MASLDIATTITNVKTMLGSLAAWQTICSVPTAAEALERIHEGGIEEDGSETLCPCIILDVNPLQTDWMPTTSHGDAVIEVRIELEVPEEERCSYQRQYIWTWQQVSALLAGINGAVGQSGGLMIEGLNMSLKPSPIDPDDNNGRIEWGCILELVLKLI